MPIAPREVPKPLPQAEAVENVKDYPAARAHQTGGVVGEAGQAGQRIQTGERGDQAIELLCVEAVAPGIVRANDLPRGTAIG